MKSVTNFSQVTKRDHPVGVLVVDLVPDRLQQVGLAQADAAVDEQRVPARGWRLGHHARRRVGELVGRADDELVEGVARDQVRAAAPGRGRAAAPDRRGIRVAARHPGVPFTASSSVTSKSTVKARCARVSRSLQDRREEIVLEPFLVVAVRRPQADAPVVDADTLDRAQPEVPVRGLDHRFDRADGLGPELKHPAPPVHSRRDDRNPQ